MKIERKIILSNSFNVALIVLISFFAYQNLDLVLAKLRFVEIADDLNASFLEMRLSEKNYFLYKDRKALAEIEEKLDKTMESLSTVRNDIVRAIGETDLGKLETHMRSYADAVGKTRRKGVADEETMLALRTEGKRLKEFSEEITRLERRRVSDILTVSKRILLYSFLVILILAVAVSHFISQKILRSLRSIEKLASSISEGNFQKIDDGKSNDELGSVVNAINSMSDELSRREEELIQSKKLASLGVLTAGVAHELTNPLNNISMIAQNFIEFHDILSKEKMLDLMNTIQEETQRIEKIVKNLLDFSKPKEAILREADINETIQEALKLMQNTLEISNIEVKLDLCRGLSHVSLDKDQIHQVLVNLMTNAVHAMPSGGKLFIATRQGKEKDFVEISVMDEGKGIPPEYLPHIFDPFFSTKGEGGTGLGLSVSYGIIKRHKGTISVSSKVGVGTTFTIKLPAYKQEEV
ncbi:MAG TPA: ATP-binding protein [Thermodesulfovibrionales bacterium]|jgi:signal transduction histidine kinase|nr:ATP-binding protein [Thermodesulfovibrionales bacterium]